ncbi:MAG: hypothetical protein Q9214_007464, partial [Letrouitia sp. 1 TL-2023]
MDFHYSEIVDPSIYQTEGLCEGIPLRTHKDPDKETVGALRAQHDWTRLVGPIGLYKGGLGVPYSFMRVTVPECIPERLEIISYANEFAFLYDGSGSPDLGDNQSDVFFMQTSWRTLISTRHVGILSTETIQGVDLIQNIESDRQIIDVFGDGVLSHNLESDNPETETKSNRNGQKRIQLQIMAEMVAIDKERA